MVSVLLTSNELLKPAPRPASRTVLASPSATPAPFDPLPYVNPMIGTDVGAPDYGFGNGLGQVFPGAVYPHGMLQWSPDTTKESGGYRYGESTVRGFSLTHFSGRGCPNYLDFPFLPTTAPMDVSPGTQWQAYSMPFSHHQEVASPGEYAVTLDRDNIGVRLTVTPRTGIGVFTFPDSANGTLLINAGGSAMGDSDDGTGIEVVGERQVVGFATSGHFCWTKHTYTVYMAAEFDRPFAQFGTWNGDALAPSGRTSRGAHSGAFLTFDTSQHAAVRVKVALSYVSEQNALDNLRQEDAGWDFDAVCAAAQTAWRDALGAIEVRGGSRDEEAIFYTALYHSLLHPNIFSDVNGQYMGFDGQVHTADGYTQYANFSNWDIYRSEIQLLALLEPNRVSDMAHSLIADAQQGGGGFPRWGAANGNTGDMVGDAGTAVVAGAYAFGATQFDLGEALHIMTTSATVPGIRSGGVLVRPALGDYLNWGYIPYDVDDAPWGPAATTLDYATDDFCIAQLGKAAGDSHTYDAYMARAGNWRHLFNSATGYIEPRLANGAFLPGFSHTTLDGFVEGDAAQYTWEVPFDLPGLFSAMGGNERVVQRLDEHFAQLNAGTTSPFAMMGNEVEFSVPWEYDFAGAPQRTQDVVRRILLELYRNTPGGLSGNDDGGALSSFYVWGALGLFPAIPCVGGLALGSPLFAHATIHLGGGATVRIEAPAASDEARYVRRLTVNGAPYADTWLPIETLKDGATLNFALATTPAGT